MRTRGHLVAVGTGLQPIVGCGDQEPPATETDTGGLGTEGPPLAVGGELATVCDRCHEEHRLGPPADGVREERPR